MQKNVATERFHDLDALRAWAMLLGVVLHTAWMMTPIYWGSPIHDCDGAYGPFWLIWFIHFFRLQAFFLIAGFFANMVLQRRGQWGFIKHRLTRIGIPFVVGCVVIYPIWFLQDTWAGILRGRIRTDESFWTVFQTQIEKSLSTVLDTFHLWFLYDLLVIYALTLIVRFLFRQVIDRRNFLRPRIHRSFRRLMQSPFLLLFLTVPSALLLMPTIYWSGIEGYPIWLRPDWAGVVSYWIFFALGWFLFAHLDLLAIVQRGWVKKLAVGTVLSISLFAIYEGYIRVRVTYLYPIVVPEDVRYAPLRDSLLAAREQDAKHPLHGVWHAFTQPWQEFLAETTKPNQDESAGIAAQLNDRVITSERFEDLAAWNLAAIPGDPAELEKLKAPERNRKILERLLPGVIAPKITDRPSVIAGKLAYSLSYAFCMWLLVFGFIGFFRHFFVRSNPAMRYLADSSYWLYMIHLNLLFLLAIFVADIPMTWPVKFLFYNVAAVAIMIPTYHWCVRSTFIGQILNGRKYPYVPLHRSALFTWSDDTVNPPGRALPAKSPLEAVSEPSIPLGNATETAASTADAVSDLAEPFDSREHNEA